MRESNHYSRWLHVFLGTTLLIVSASFSQTVTLYAELAGSPNGCFTCFVPHGDSAASGLATLTIHLDSTPARMDYAISVESQYAITQAHVYRVQQHALEPWFDSTFCWGPPWWECNYLVGFGMPENWLAQMEEDVRCDRHSWFLMLHTEGGHFAVDSNGSLIEYVDDDGVPNLSAYNQIFDAELEVSECCIPQPELSPPGCLVQMASVATCGQTAAQFPTRFNNRVGRSLDDRLLRICENTCLQTASPCGSPLCDGAINPTPFPDALGRMWMQSDGQGGFVLTPDAIAAGYDLNKKYLFFLYDDQGKLSKYNNGGPEGALGGFLKHTMPCACPADIAPIPNDQTVNVDDLLAVIASWGKPGCVGDIDGNNVANVDDLLAVINAWGPCQ